MFDMAANAAIPDVSADDDHGSMLTAECEAFSSNSMMFTNARGEQRAWWFASPLVAQAAADAAEAAIHSSLPKWRTVQRSSKLMREADFLLDVRALACS